MDTYRRITKELARYNPRWRTELHVKDIACWLNKFYSSQVILDLYAESMAEKRATGSLDDLALASKVAKSAYVALDPRIVRQLATDEVLQEMIDVVIERRVEAAKQRKESIQRLVAILRGLLPAKYNPHGGA